MIVAEPTAIDETDLIVEPGKNDADDDTEGDATPDLTPSGPDKSNGGPGDADDGKTTEGDAAEPADEAESIDETAAAIAPPGGQAVPLQGANAVTLGLGFLLAAAILLAAMFAILKPR